MEYDFICHQNRGYEDRFTIVHTDKLKYYAVFDGHGQDDSILPMRLPLHGQDDSILPMRLPLEKDDSQISTSCRDTRKLSREHVVQYVKENLHIHIINVLSDHQLSNDEVCSRIKSVFIKMDLHMKKSGGKFGCTAGIVIIFGNRVFQVNLGDSRSILYSDNMVCETMDHTIESERERILKDGGTIEDDRVGGLLNISRAFGDYSLKPGVSCIPDIIITQKTSGMKFLLATDGLYSGFFDDSSLVLDIVNELTSHSQIVKVLCKQAILNNYGDDTTIISGDV